MTTNTSAQDTAIKATVKMVIERDSDINITAYVITVSLTNSTEKGVYLPNTMFMFEDQKTDSIVIYKNYNGNYKKYMEVFGQANLVDKGGPYVTADGNFFKPAAAEYILPMRYYPRFRTKLQEGEQIILRKYEQTAGSLPKASFPLFLRPNETFILYSILQPDMFIKEEGTYRISYFYKKKKELPSLPKKLANYKKINPGKVATTDFFLR